MSMTRSTVVGVFDERAKAEQAIDALYNAGVPSDHIRYSGQAASGGFMASIKSLFSGQNASSSVLRDDLVNMGLSNDEADYYAQQYDGGRTIVAVNDGPHAQDAMNILRSNGGYDYGSHSATTGTGAAYADTTAATSTQAAYADTTAGTGTVDTDYTRTGARETLADRARGTVNDVNTDEARSLRLREEQLQVEKQRVQSGEVRLHKEVVAEQKNIDVPVTHEEVIVERHPYTEARATDAPIGSDEVIRVPVTDERVNVTKTQVETGEVAIGKRQVQETQRVTDTVRREEARLEQDGDARIRGDINQGETRRERRSEDAELRREERDADRGNI